MFERFSAQARAVVVQAQDEARELRHDRIGTEHLVLAMLRDPESGAAQALLTRGVDRDALRAAVTEAWLAQPGREQLDAEALDSIGIDLDAVREKVEAEFGPGALDRPGGSGRWSHGRLPFSPRAKKVLELSLREAVALHSKEIASQHLLLGLIRDGGGMGARVLVDSGVDLRALGDDLRTQLRQR